MAGYIFKGINIFFGIHYPSINQLKTGQVVEIFNNPNDINCYDILANGEYVIEISKRYIILSNILDDGIIQDNGNPVMLKEIFLKKNKMKIVQY